MFLSKIFDSNDKQIKLLQKTVDTINKLEKDYQNSTQKQLQQITQEWKDELSKLSDEKHLDYLDSILPQAYAVMREASKRTLKQRHYDVQLMAGITLHQGKIAEQKTGEGKTLAATLPLFLNSLTGRGVHLVTPNDYLSRHGAGWMGQAFNYLGISVGVIMQQRSFIYDETYDSTEFEDDYSRKLREVPRQQTYQCDVVYGTNHEFGFDYLRDNMSMSLNEMVQTNKRGDWGHHYFAIVDEVDSILIDSARTPLIISTTSNTSAKRYEQADTIVKNLAKDTDYEVDEQRNSASLTDLGIRRVENMLKIGNLYEQDFEMVHLIEQALSAHALFTKDKEYVVKDGQIVIIDQFTGRLLPSNRFSQGLHQAIEAKEHVQVQDETRTRAEISYQNYFRMYEKLAGMTGTAMTEAEEFYKIYKLDVVVIPTNKPVIRKDFNDVVYKSESAKFKAVADEIAQKHESGQPVLVGTTSVERSQLLHQYLSRKNIPHQILNAKNHEKEAQIISQAGKKGAVTISTNMAGRGVDIILGGDPSTSKEQQEVKDLGGLHVIGTERHESRRIDNQLRGRSGRQGDPGSSRFYISLQDTLMRVFGGEQVEKIMDRFKFDENIPIEAGLVSKVIENAQKKVEGFNFDTRKYLVERDDIMNVHREVIYQLRRRILEISEGDQDQITWFISKLQENAPENTDINEIWQKFSKQLGEKVWQKSITQIALPVVDYLWMEHLVDMDHIKQGVGLQGYAQKDPLVEYKRESYQRFELMLQELYVMISERFSKIQDVQVVTESTTQTDTSKLNYARGNLNSGVDEEAAALQSQRGSASNLQNNQTANKVVDKSGRELKVEKVKSGKQKVGRNDPCPCGSGKKYKNCHGA